MFKAIVASVAAAAALLLFAPPPAVAQDMAVNGNFELQDLGSWWTPYGDNTGAQMIQYDVDGSGGDTWCWQRQPGSDFGNGGLRQDVTLVAGVTYQFDADVCYYAC